MRVIATILVFLSLAAFPAALPHAASAAPQPHPCSHSADQTAVPGYAGHSPSGKAIAVCCVGACMPIPTLPAAIELVMIARGALAPSADRPATTVAV